MSGSPIKISSARQLNYSEGIPDDLIPTTGYEYDLGSPFKKWLSIYAGELNVETLVSQNTIATIEGRILVGPSTTFVDDMDYNLMGGVNPSFEIAGSGGADVFASWNEYNFSGSSGSNIQRLALGDGTYYCGLIAFSGSIPQIATPTFSINSNQNYVISCSAVGSGSSWGGWGVYNPSGGSWIFLQNTGISGSSWTKVSQSFTTPVSCSGINVYLISGSIISKTVGFDNLILNRSGSNPNTIFVKHNEMSGSDIVYAEARGQVEFMQIINGPSGSGPYQYDITRNLDGSGSNIWYAGDAIFNTGIVGDGFMDLYSVHGVKAVSQYGPSIAGNVRNSLTYNDWGTKWAIGNLNGLYDYSSTTWGAAFGGYGSGSANITIDNVNGLRLRNYNQTVIQLDNSGSAIIAGKLSMLGTGGAIAIGVIPPSGSSSGTGIWIDRNGLYGTNSSIPQAYIGSDGRFYAGLGNVQIDSAGITIADVVSGVRLISWQYNSGSGYKTVGWVGGDYGGGTNNAMLLTSKHDTGDPWAVANVTLSSYDIATSRDARVTLSSSASGTVLGITSFDFINFTTGSLAIGKSNATQRLDVAGSAIISGDIYTVPWTDYSATSTIVGWSAFTTKSIYYKKIGKLVLVQFYLSGTSDTTICTFTLPYANNALLSAWGSTGPLADNGAALTVAGLIELPASSNLVSVYKNMNYLGWTAANAKYITGNFFYETA